MPQNRPTKIFTRQPRWNMIGPVILPGPWRFLLVPCPRGPHSGDGADYIWCVECNSKTITGVSVQRYARQNARYWMFAIWRIRREDRKSRGTGAKVVKPDGRDYMQRQYRGYDTTARFSTEQRGLTGMLWCISSRRCCEQVLITLDFSTLKKVKVARTRLPSVGFWSWSRFLAISLQVTWDINPAVGCHYFPPGLQLPPQPLRGLLPILLLGEQRHDGCKQFA